MPKWLKAYRYNITSNKHLHLCACVYQPEVLAQTKHSDYFRNPSKRLPLKFCTVTDFNNRT